MNADSPSPVRRLAALFLSAAVVSTAMAQVAPAAPASTSANDELLVLSPFVVSTETERGYQATETLAGMRIRTDLKDVGAAIDVLTEDFLDDVGAIDMNDALKYAANMQYAQFPSASDWSNYTQWFSSSFISRGIVGSTVLTDFFPTGSLPIDRYNTENLTLMRGPNAILFGIGSPSGIVGASSKRALLNRSSNEVRFLADTNETLRTEFDVSRVLIANKLAVRVAALLSDKHTDQEPSLERRNAIYGTVTYKPFSKTTITVNAEDGIRNRIHVQNHIVMDAYTPWVRAGKPMVSSRVGFPATGPAYSTAVGSGLQNTSNGSYLVYIQGSNLPVMDWRGMARGSQWGNMVPTGGPGTGLINSTDRSLMDNISFYPSTAILPLNVNIFGDNNRNDLNYEVQSIFIEQNIWGDLDLELAWNQHTSDYQFNILSGGANAKIFVDPNLFLPNGDSNPYAGMPYIDTGNGGNGQRRTGEINKYITRRATLSYKLDLDDKKIFRNIGFGNYRFGGLAQEANYTQKLLSTRIVNVTPIPGNATANPLNQNANRLSRRYYLTPGAGNTFQYLGADTFSQAAVVGNTPANTGPLNFEERTSDESPRNNRQDTESFVAAVQGEWWASRDGSYHHLTGMYGWREDTQTNRSQSFTRNAQGEYPIPVTPGGLNFAGVEPAGVWGAPASFTAHTKSYNVTFRPIPQVRLFYNYSDIFRASAANFRDVWGTPLRPAFGETEDYGVKLELFDERYFITATKFETGVIDSTFDNTGNLREPINQILSAILENGSPSASDSQLITGLQENLVRPFSYRDDTTEGYEFSLIANPIDGWNARLTFGTQKTVVSTAFDDWVPYFAEYRPFWQSYSSVGLVSPATGYTTVADAIARADTRLTDARVIIGQQPTDQRTRNSSFSTSYRFQSGRLKDFRVGGGYRWASANILGYARNAQGNLDPSRPFKGKEQFFTDLYFGYSRKVWNGRYDWDVQVNIFNVLDDQSIRAYQAVDDGQGNPVIVRTFLPEPLTVQLTTSLRF